MSPLSVVLDASGSWLSMTVRDTSGLENVSNSLGSILLGFLENDSENLMAGA